MSDADSSYDTGVVYHKRADYRLDSCLLLGFVLLFTNIYAHADVVPILGQHPILRFEKSENPQNVLIAYTKLNHECQIEGDAKKPSTPIFDFYWLLDGKTYKPVHPLIKSQIAKKIKLDSNADLKKNSSSFFVTLGDLAQISEKFSNARLLVTSKKVDGHCETTAVFQSLDRSLIDLAEVNISKIYSESKKVLFPPFRKIIHVKLEGVHLKDKLPFSRTY